MQDECYPSHAIEGNARPLAPHQLDAEGSASPRRLLQELIPLIVQEIEAGNAAGIEHFRRAGEMLLEAKKQVGHGEWGGWLKRNFRLSQRSANDYMRLAALPNSQHAANSSLREALREAQREAQRKTAGVNGEGSWQRRLAHEQQDKLVRRQVLRQLARRLIDAGYRALSLKAHPDKGGSNEEMADLNEVRKMLKRAV